MIRTPLRSGLVFTLAVLVLTAGAVTAATAAPTDVDTGSQTPAVTAVQDDDMSDDEMDDSMSDDEMDDGMDGDTNDSMDDDMDGDTNDSMDDDMNGSMGDEMDGDDMNDDMNGSNESEEMSDDEMDDEDDGLFGTLGFALVGLLVVAGLGGVVAVRRFA